MLVAHEICESLNGYDRRSRQMFATHGRRYLLAADASNSLDMLVALGNCSRADDLARGIESSGAWYGAIVFDRREYFLPWLLARIKARVKTWVLVANPLPGFYPSLLLTRVKARVKARVKWFAKIA